MNENIEVIQEDPKENTIQNDNNNESSETSSETIPIEKIETTETIDNTYTIVIDGQEQNYLIQTYKEMKTTNFLLYLLLITIVLMFVLSKFYYFAKSIFRVRF